MPLNPGSRLGIFEIVAPLGAGGMGEVYRARDTSLGRDVAIKVLPDAVAADPERLSRFQKEAKVLASLNHPNIGHIYGVESNALVMELIEGERLKGPLPLDTALNYARQIAEGLEAAHDRGIVHRDLKPANIMVTHDGLVKILDFGLAKAAEESASTSDSATRTISHTASGMILGTAAYMSPEQARGLPVDRRTDIWAFGAVLFELLAGKPAFAGNTVTDILASVLKSEPDWAALPSTTPTRIRQLLRRSLEPDKKLRLQAIGEARIALDTTDAAEPSQSPISRRNVWPWIAALLIVAIGAFIADVWRANRTAPEAALIRINGEIGPDVRMERPDNGSFFAVSPDGSMLAIAVRDTDGKIRLATRRLDQTKYTTLAGTDGGVSPVFSPDGQWLAFNADRKLKKIAVAGGPAVTLCDATSRVTASWATDGRLVSSLGITAGLSIIPAAGGTPQPLTRIDPTKGEQRHGWPQVLPGNEAVLFTSQRVGQSLDDADVEIALLKDGTRRTIHRGAFFARYLPSGHLVWLRQNSLYAAPFNLRTLALTGDPLPVLEDIHVGQMNGGDFAFSANGLFVYATASGEVKQSIFWMDSSGKTSELQSTPGRYGNLRFSPDGKRLAFTSVENPVREDVWIRDLERGTAARLSLLAGVNNQPVWTPDSKTVIFWSATSDGPGLYAMAADGTGSAQRLTDGKQIQFPRSVSPDGKYLAFTQTAARGNTEAYVASIEGDASHLKVGPPQPFVETSFTTFAPTFSPDGRWLAFYLHDPEKEGVWVKRFPGSGDGWLISDRGDEPIWARNSHELFFTAGSHTIMHTRYTPNGEAFVFDKPEPWSNFRLLDLATYDLAPDGKRVAIILNADGTADKKPITHLTFLLNFGDDLRRRVPPHP